VPDAEGISLIVGLVVKEFLSVVDMALLLGPGNPPTFAVFLLTLVADPGSRAAASAGALLLALGVFVIFVLLFGVERLIASVARYRRGSGRRGAGSKWVRRSGQWFVVAVLLFSAFSMLMLLLWSFTYRWRFPHALPQSWTTDQWLTRGDTLIEPLLLTVCFATATALLAMLAAVVWLELERMQWVPKLNGVWFVPILIPQVTLLFGWQAIALLLGADGHWLTVVYSHWIYALPYVLLILAIGWREHDPHWHHAAKVLGAGYFRTLWRVRGALSNLSHRFSHQLWWR